MTDTDIHTSTCKFREGKLEEYRAFARRLAAPVDEKEPDMLHFGISIDAQAMEAGTVQVHRSVEKMTRHMKAIEPMQPEGFELIDVTQIAVRIYGAPTPAVLDRRERSSGRPVSA